MADGTEALTEKPTSGVPQDPEGDGDLNLSGREGPTLHRVLRGMVGIGGAWAVGWAGLGLGLWLVLSLVMGVTPDFLFTLLIPVLLNWAIDGFLTGAWFSAILAFFERRKLFDELSLPRVALWGALAGATVSVLTAGTASLFLAIMNPQWFVSGAVRGGLLGAGFSVATTLLAKSANEDELFPESDQETPSLPSNT